MRLPTSSSSQPPKTALWDPLHVSDHFCRLTKQAGLPQIRLHDLWHGAATYAHAARVDPKTVSQMLGYASVVLTV